MPSDKPLLVFMPGLGASGATYGPFLNRLRRDYEVVSADHGLRFPAKITYDFFEQAIAEVADGRPFILVGHSMGGAVALHYAATHPQQVKRVVAIAPVLFPFIRVRRRGRKFHSFLIALSGGNFVHLLQLAKIRRRILGGGRARLLYDWAGTIDLTKELSRVSNAVIVVPRHEEVIPLPHFSRVEADYPNIAVRYVPGSHNTVALAPWQIMRPLKEALRG